MTSPAIQVSSHTSLLIVALAGLGTVFLFLFAWRRLRRTTLVAPCLWAVVSCVCLTLLGLFHFESETGSSAPWRFVVGVGAFCPLMAVLGAKRPQHVGWQWVVASLWLVLAWPAGQAMLSGDGLELFIAWKLFVVGLIVVGLLNYLPTRHWFATLLVAAGQLALMAEFLWSSTKVDSGLLMILALALFFVATLSVSGTFFRARRGNQERREVPGTYSREWLRFRDAYGAFWALRILGRVNETASLQDWPMRLEWHGFTQIDDGQLSEQQREEVEQCFETLLRRFW